MSLSVESSDFVTVYSVPKQAFFPENVYERGLHFRRAHS